MGVSPEEVQRRMRERAGLVRLGERTHDEAIQAIRRSLPRTVDAVRLFEGVELRLGDGAARDFWAFPNERALLVRDRDRPGWWLPHRLVYLDLDRHVPPEPKSPLDDWPPLPPIDDEKLLPLAAPAPPARLRIDLGPAYFEGLFDERGRIHQTVSTCGDTFCSRGNEPFVLDPHARPPQAPPLPLLVRDDLDPSGHPVDEVADWVAALRPEEADRGRVWVPVPTPGGVTGSWTRGLWNLRLAAWHGQLDPGAAGWAVADAFNGAAVATGPTFDEAVAAWRALVARVQPLPPVEREVELPEPTEPSEPTSEYDPETGVSRSSLRIVWFPPVTMTWPEPRPENVPAVAVPIEAAPEVPAALAARGYARVLRLFGDYGESGFAFVRDRPDGYDVIGDSAAEAIDPETLDAELDELDRVQHAEYLTMGMFADCEPWNDPKYPMHLGNYQAWDASGRIPDLKRVGGQWGAELTVHVWDANVRYAIVRVRFLDGPPRVGRPA